MQDSSEYWTIEQAVALLCTGSDEFAVGARGWSPTRLVVAMALREGKGTQSLRAVSDGLRLINEAAALGLVTISARPSGEKNRMNVPRETFIDLTINDMTGDRPAGGERYAIGRYDMAEWEGLRVLRSQLIELERQHSPAADAERSLSDWRQARETAWLPLLSAVRLVAQHRADETVAAALSCEAGTRMYPDAWRLAASTVRALLEDGTLNAKGMVDGRPGERLAVDPSVWSEAKPDWFKGQLAEFSCVTVERRGLIAALYTPIVEGDADRHQPGGAVPSQISPNFVASNNATILTTAPTTLDSRRPTKVRTAVIACMRRIFPEGIPPDGTPMSKCVGLVKPIMAEEYRKLALNVTDDAWEKRIISAIKSMKAEQEAAA